MAIPRRQRQGEIYRANLRGDGDARLLVLSSNETDGILDRQALAFEVVLESVERVAGTPVGASRSCSATSAGLREGR